MALMLLDHMWVTVIPGNGWMTCAGRLAFPIFAFLSVEGYFHTSNVRKYLLRLGICALISEIPFNLMTAGTVFFPFHQNVLFSLLMGVAGIHLMETVRKTGKVWLSVLTDLCVVLSGLALGFITLADYYAAGFLTIFTFYFFRGRKWWCILGQIILMCFINFKMLGGQVYPLSLFGLDIEFPQQGFAVLALIPIWLYNGKRKIKSKLFQYFCYAFYPLHMLILYLIAVYVI